MSSSGLSENRDWIRTVLDRFEGQLTRYAQRITGNLDTAREVVQETFLRLCRENPERLDGHLAEWLFTVCRNRAIDVKRKEDRMATLSPEQLGHSPANELAPPQDVQQRDEAGHILRLLEELPDNQREVIQLKFQSELTYREISSVTGLSVSNVGFLIHRGLKTIRQQLTPQD
jgi:RNA polymerase sigma-70 factor (ECF subfamily)